MSGRKRIAVIGYGNVGKACVAAVATAPDMLLAGVVRRHPTPIPEYPGVPVVGSVDELGKIDGALVASPTRQVERVADALLAKGIATADSFDIHGEPLLALRRKLDAVAKANGVSAVISAGWDPGTDSMVRGILEFAAPRGITFTNFGPGMSMGHSTAAKAKDGVRDALSLTFPAGQGIHRRLVYVELEPGASFEEVERAIKEDAYFVKDDTRVVQVESVAALMDMGHGVVIERKGVSGTTHNQLFRFEMRIQNPALTAQIMLSALRAAMRQPPGCYTPLELPIVDFLPGDREAWIGKLM